MLHATSKKKKRSEHSLEGCSHRGEASAGASRNEVMQNAGLYSAIRLKVTRSIGPVRCLVALLVWCGEIISSEGTPTQGDPWHGKVCPGPAPCSLFYFGFVALGWTSKRGLPMTLLRLESFVDDGFACVSWDTCLATFPRKAMACGEAGVSAPSWKAVCRSGCACAQITSASRRYLGVGGGDWLSRLCSRVFGGVDSRVARTSWAPSQSVNPTQCKLMQLLSTASQQNGATFNGRFLQSNLPLLPWKRRSRTSFCRRRRVKALYHSIHDVSSLSLLVSTALESAIRWPRVRMSTKHRS